MNKNIKTDSGYIGLDERIYELKPNHEEDFTYTYKLNEFKDSQNFVQKIKQIITKAFKNLTTITIKKEGNNI